MAVEHNAEAYSLNVKHDSLWRAGSKVEAGAATQGPAVVFLVTAAAATVPDLCAHLGEVVEDEPRLQVKAQSAVLRREGWRGRQDDVAGGRIRA